MSQWRYRPSPEIDDGKRRGGGVTQHVAVHPLGLAPDPLRQPPVDLPGGNETDGSGLVLALGVGEPRLDVGRWPALGALKALI